MSTLAIRGGEKLRSRSFPTWPIWGDRERQLLMQALESGHWGRLTGRFVQEFEEAFAREHEARYGVCVVNGTVALALAVQAAGLRPGEEVIVPPYTFVATATAVLMAGGVPVFADIDPQTFCLDPAAVEAAITPRTRAIIPVHLGGHPADMDGLGAVARRHGLVLIEDAAHAHGSAWQGRKVGALGDFGCFSFQASKNLTAGEGGIILTNDGTLFDRAHSLHNVGRVRSGHWYEHHLLGANFRMTEFQGAVLLAQLERSAEQFEHRARMARYLDRRLSEIPGITPQALDPRVTQRSYHLYVFRYDAAAFGGASRDQFVRALSAEGIPCSTGYRLLNRQPVLQRVRRERTHGFATYPGDIDYENQRLPVAERLSDVEGVWLPQNVLLGNEEDVEDVARAIEKIQHHARELVGAA